MTALSSHTSDRLVLASVAARLNKADGPAALWLMTDLARLPDPVAAIARLPRGAGVIVRDYDLPDRRSYAAKLVRQAKSRGLFVLVAADASLARALGADGVHLPAGLAKRAAGIKRDWPAAFVTAAAHNAAQLIKAARNGCDGVFISPIFTTQSHIGAAPLGIMQFQALCRQAHGFGLYAYALGGLDKQTAPMLKSTGADGLAAIGALNA